MMRRSMIIGRVNQILIRSDIDFSAHHGIIYIVQVRVQIRI